MLFPERLTVPSFVYFTKSLADEEMLYSTEFCPLMLKEMLFPWLEYPTTETRYATSELSILDGRLNVTEVSLVKPSSTHTLPSPRRLYLSLFTN